MWLSVHAALLMGPAAADEPPARAGSDTPTQTDDVARAALRKANPAHGARQPKLLGAGSCSWSTAMMARRALSDGVPYTYVGHLQVSENQLPSRVATPYTVGPDAAIHVVANEVLGVIERYSMVNGWLDLRGRLVEVDQVRYLVVTDVSKVER